MQIDPGTAGASVGEFLRPLGFRPQSVFEDDVDPAAQQPQPVAVEHPLEAFVEVGVGVGGSQRSLPIIGG